MKIGWGIGWLFGVLIAIAMPNAASAKVLMPDASGFDEISDQGKLLKNSIQFDSKTMLVRPVDITLEQGNEHIDDADLAVVYSLRVANDSVTLAADKHDQPLEIKVLDNDTDPGGNVAGDDLEITAVTNGQHGTARTNGHQISYQLNGNLSGTPTSDQITYTVQDRAYGLSAKATVDIKIERPELSLSYDWLAINMVPQSNGLDEATTNLTVHSNIPYELQLQADSNDAVLHASKGDAVIPTIENDLNSSTKLPNRHWAAHWGGMDMATDTTWHRIPSSSLPNEMLVYYGKATDNKDTTVPLTYGLNPLGATEGKYSVSIGYTLTADLP